MRALLEDPERVTQEYRRRTSEARDGAAAPEEIARLDRQIATLKRGIGRLIDSYAEGVIDKTEFEPRIAGMKTRLAKLTQQHQAALEAAEAERNLSLVTGRLEDFAAKVRQGLDSLDWLGRREILAPSSGESRSTTTASR